MIKEIKKEEENFIPKVNNFQEKNSIFNCIIHIIYFTPEIFSFWDKNKIWIVIDLKNIREKNIDFLEWIILINLHRYYIFFKSKTFL